MAEDLKRTGLEFVSKGVLSFVNDIKKVNSSALQIPETFREASEGGNVFNDIMTGVVGALNPAAGAFLALSNVVVTFTAVVSTVVMEISKLGAELGRMITISTMAAGKFEQLAQSAAFVAMRFGNASEYTYAQIEAMREMGLVGEVAAKSMVTLAANNLDLSKATELTSVAQDVSAITAQSTSESMDKLNYAIATGHSYTLKMLGINISFEKSYSDIARQLGKNVEQLSDVERMQARLNYVLSYGTRIQGAYEQAMQNGYRVYQEIPVVLDNIKLAVGKPFQDSFNKVMQIVWKLTDLFLDMLKSGGGLYEILNATGAVASVAAEALNSLLFVTDKAPQSLDEMGNAVDTVDGALSQAPRKWLKHITDFGKGLGEKMLENTANALQWGGELIVNFASGMVQAAAAVLTVAMNAISGLLRWWLEPGSPPRVAPEVDLWGAQTMNEYFKGFTKADFDILSSLKSPIRSALSIMVDAEKLGKEEASELYRSLTLGLAQAIKSGDFSKVVGQLRRSLGEFGFEISVLADKQLQLGHATEDLVRSKKKLEQADRDLLRAEADINRVMNEFNLAAKQGQPDAILNQKRKEFELAKKQKTVAQQNKTLAEGEVKSSQERVDILKEQVDTQKALVDTLLDFAKTPFDISESFGKGLKEALSGLGLGEDFGGAIEPLSSIFDESFINMKTMFSDRMAEIWQGLVDQWNEDVAPYLTEIKGLAEDIKEALKPAIKEVNAEGKLLVEWMKDRIFPRFVTITDNITTGIENLRDEITKLVPALGEGEGKKLGLTSALRKLVQFITASVVGHFVNFSAAFKFLTTNTADWKDEIEILADTFVTSFTTILDALGIDTTKIVNFYNIQKNAWKMAVREIEGENKKFKDNWQAVVDWLKGEITFKDAIDKIESSFKDAFNRMKEAVSGLVSVLQTLWGLLGKDIPLPPNTSSGGTNQKLNQGVSGGGKGSSSVHETAAIGTNGWKNVPVGFNNDSFRLGLSSGERYMVQTQAQANAFDNLFSRMVSSNKGYSMPQQNAQVSYNLTMNTNMDAQSVKQGFDMMKSVVGNRVM